MSADALPDGAAPTVPQPTGWWAVGVLPLAGLAVAWAWLPTSVRLLLVTCLALSLIGLVLWFLRGPATRSSRTTTAGMAGIAVAGLATGIAIAPTPPPAGVPLLTHLSVSGQAALAVLVVPQRPGWNLIHIDAEEAAVGTSATHLVTAVPRPGTTGVWALVKLPAGRPTLQILDGATTVHLRLNTGSATRPLPGLAGPDGPECASAVIGALTAGQDTPLLSCPSQSLSRADAGALTGMIHFIADRGIHHVTLVSDSSPRSRQAVRVVLAACARDGITADTPGHDPGGPVVLVSGWAGADAALQQVVADSLPSEGTYLAPWLLDASLLSYSAGQLLPLRFDPTMAASLTYITQLNEAFPGEVATESGYTAWLSVKGRQSAQSGSASLYAASVVYDPSEIGANHALPLTWMPGGTITPVGTPLAAPVPR